jgi:hypothetical protein
VLETLEYDNTLIYELFMMIMKWIYTKKKCYFCLTVDAEIDLI